MSKRTAAIVGAVLFAAIVSVYLVAVSMANRAEPHLTQLVRGVLERL